MILRFNWLENFDTIGRQIAQAWLDEEFRQYFIQNPEEVLRNVGIVIPEELDVQVDTSAFFWEVQEDPNNPCRAIFTIPLSPRPEYVSDEELRYVIEHDRSVVMCIF